MRKLLASIDGDLLESKDSERRGMGVLVRCSAVASGPKDRYK